MNAPARVLRHYHFEGDGCLEEGRPAVRLFGAALPSQVAPVHGGWIGPMTLAPRGVRRMGVGGQPPA